MYIYICTYAYAYTYTYIYTYIYSSLSLSIQELVDVHKDLLPGFTSGSGLIYRYILIVVKTVVKAVVKTVVMIVAYYQGLLQAAASSTGTF